jgi:ribosomal protein S12 methylthiotransferase
MMGRHAGQAPEIDGCVYLSGGSALPGEFRRVRITQASDYDLVGELDIEEDSAEVALPPAPIAISHRASDGRRVLRTYR